MTAQELQDKGLFYPKDHYPHPAFKGNEVAIVLCCDLKYLAYSMVVVRNIIELVQPDKNYDLFIQMESPPPALIELCCKEVEGLTNVRLRFIDHSHFIRERNFNLGYWGMATFYKLFAEPTFKHYKKVLYLDSDILILKDIATFTDIDLEGVYLAAVRDSVPNFIINGDPTKKPINFPIKVNGFKGQISRYFREYLGFTPQETLNYLNFGMVIFNLEKFRQDKLFDELLSFLENSKPFAIAEQDYLNVFFKERSVKILGQEWVTLYYNKSDLFYDCMTQEQVEEMKKGMKDPFLIHFLATPKPWFLKNPKEPYSILYWTYVSRSCFSSLVELSYLERFFQISIEGYAGSRTLKARILNKLPHSFREALILNKQKFKKIRSFLKK